MELRVYPIVGDVVEQKDRWDKSSVSGLEADIAYFDARLSLLEEEPMTAYQKAQLHTYKILESALIQSLVRLRNRSD
jgi:hypothetical protein